MLGPRMMGKVALSDAPWINVSTTGYSVLAPVYVAFCFAMSKRSRGLERDLNRLLRH
jgi:general L-amino acid transport system permease protein